MKSISVVRINLIKKYKNYAAEQSEKADFCGSPFSYPCTWFYNVGYLKIRSLYKFSFLKIIIQYMREVYLIGTLKNIELLKPYHKLKDKKKFKNMYITWCKKEDLDHKFNFNSTHIPRFSKNNLWVLINVGKNKIENSKINKNLYILQKKKEFSFTFLIRTVLKIIILNNYNIKKSLSKINVDAVFSNYIYNQTIKILHNSNIKKIYLPFEGQPFQKNLIKKIREKKKIKFYGFLNALQPFPIHLYDKTNKPDFNYSTSRIQIKQLVRFFNWEKEKIKLIKSNRFDYKNTKKYYNKILLPFSIHNHSILTNNLRLLLNIMPKNYFGNLVSVPHPSSKNNIEYKKFLQNINELIELNIHKFNNYLNKKSIVFGSTSMVLEALECDATVFHIVNEPELECLDNNFWPCVDINRIRSNIFKYKKRHKKKLINY